MLKYIRVLSPTGPTFSPYARGRNFGGCFSATLRRRRQTGSFLAVTAPSYSANNALLLPIVQEVGGDRSFVSLHSFGACNDSCAVHERLDHPCLVSLGEPNCRHRPVCIGLRYTSKLKRPSIPAFSRLNSTSRKGKAFF